MTAGRFSLGAVVVGAAVLSATAGTAASLDGASFRVDYLFPDTSTLYPFANTPIFGMVGPGTDAVIDVEGVTDISLDFGPFSLYVLMNTILTSPTWNVASFNGLRITFTDLPATIIDFDFDPGASTFGPIATMFSATELFINWSGVSYVDDSTALFSVELVPAPIPLPATLPLLLAGLGAVGMIGLWRDRRARVGDTETT